VHVAIHQTAAHQFCSCGISFHHDTPGSLYFGTAFFLLVCTSAGCWCTATCTCCLDVVQEEDIALCEAVQLGLQEPAYGVGRYAPGPEAPMYHFHSLLYSSVMEGVQQQQQQQP
jgi:hypothetical protein